MVIIFVINTIYYGFMVNIIIFKYHVFINYMKINLGSTSNNSITISKHPEPLFVTVPPRPTRVFHSEAYIK